jgi:hypothetical protein
VEDPRFLCHRAGSAKCSSSEWNICSGMNAFVDFTIPYSPLLVAYKVQILMKSHFLVTVERTFTDGDSLISRDSRMLLSHDECLGIFSCAIVDLTIMAAVETYTVNSNRNDATMREER